MAACEREAVQPALGTPAVYLGRLRLATSERKEDSTRDQIGFLRAAGAPPYPRSSVPICVDLWSPFRGRVDQLAVATTAGLGEGDEGLGHRIGRRQALGLLAGIGAGAQRRAQAAGIDEVGADLRGGDLVGIDPHQRLERRLG